MALQQLAQGLKGGLTPLFQEKRGERKADTELARKLKHMEKMGKLEMKLKHEYEDMQFEDVFGKLKGAGLGKGQAALGALGKPFMTPEQQQLQQQQLQLGQQRVGLSQQELEAYPETLDLQRRLQEARIKAQGKFGTQRGLSDERLKLQSIFKWVNSEISGINKRIEKDTATQEDLDNLKTLRGYQQQVGTLLGQQMPDLSIPQAEPEVSGIKPSWWESLWPDKLGSSKKEQRWKRAKNQIKTDTGIDPTDTQIQLFLQKYSNFK